MKKLLPCFAAILFLAACNTSVHAPKDSGVFSEPLPESEGEQLYLGMKCHTCHGYQGAGDGFFSRGLDPKPVDFSSAEVMGLILDDQLKAAIRNGKGGVMPGYPQLTNHQVGELVRYIRSLSESPSN